MIDPASEELISLTEAATLLPRRRGGKGLLPLPTPVVGGSLLELRDFLNLDDDKTFILLVAWLACAMRPNWPVPVLVFFSEQGSGKSTATRILRLMIDPNEAPIRCAPREPRDLMIAANNGLVIALDNLSDIPDWLSDALCRLSTGGGFSTRMLYENDEEQMFNSLRPVVINGIEEVGSRSDLLDRTLQVCLPSIPEERRMPERLIFRRFDQVRPRLLGALLDAVSAGLSRIEDVKLERLPRMADSALWVVACEPALPWASGEFLRVYDHNRAGAHELALESSPIGESVRQFAIERGEWTGTSTELLEELNVRLPNRERPPQGWPKRNNALSGMVRRLASNLKAVGVHVEFPERNRKGRSMIIRTQPQTIVTTVTERHAHGSDDPGEPQSDDCASCGDGPVTIAAMLPAPSVTHRDDGDGAFPFRSGTQWSDDDEERAAIMEYEGGFSREQAERLVVAGGRTR